MKTVIKNVGNNEMRILVSTGQLKTNYKNIQNISIRKGGNMSKIKTLTFIMMFFMMVPGLWAAEADRPSSMENQVSDVSNVSLELDNYFRSLSLDNCFNGAVLVARNGQILLQDGYGYADKEMGVECTVDDVYYIASLTKAFAATCILLLEQDGKLNIKDKLSQHLPAVNTGGYEYLKDLTIEQLLNMSANITNFLSIGFEEGFDFGQPHTPAEMFALLEQGRPNAPINPTAVPKNPGDDFTYCNSCYLVLGMVIEHVSGQTFNDFLEARIFQPLGLSNTAYATGDTWEDRRPAAYNPDTCLNCDSLQKINFAGKAAYLAPSNAFSAGCLSSTVTDLFKWQEMLLFGNLLTPESKDKMFEPFLYRNFYYGLGWYVHPYKVAGQVKKLIWHWGSYFGYHGFIAHLLDENIVVIIENNFSLNDFNYSLQSYPIVREAINIVLANTPPD